MSASGSRRVFTWVRAAIMAAFLLFLIHMCVRYDLERLPGHVEELGREVKPGAMIVLGTVDENTVIGKGSLVEVVVETEQGRRRTFSQVVGVPGQVLSLEAREGGAREIFVDGISTWRTVPASSPLQPGPIPDDCYLLLDPAPGAGGADSRYLGLVPRKMLRRKILYSL